MHNPGGKVKTRLPDNVHGDAVFYGEQYRPLLRRWTDLMGPFVLFVGMNPSTADATANDPTIAREWGFATRWGFSTMYKCNVMDYRATFPKDLLSVNPCSPANLLTIRDVAAEAALIVICHGALHPKLERYGRDVVDALKADGREMWCFGLTKAGHPKHPLYLKSDTPLQRFGG